MATTLSLFHTFDGVVTEAAKGSVSVVLPFDPVTVWGRRPRYRVGGTINGHPVRAVIDADDPKLVLGPMWRRGCGIESGDQVRVTLALEGPQSADLGDDFRAALEAEPEAEAFFTDLAQFYRKGYLSWIDATKRKPDERARRIEETVRLLKLGMKERPR